ncbi:biotin/lipoyl-binding protein, partial [Enterobacter hormaechei]
SCAAIYIISDSQINGLWTRDGRVRADVITMVGEVDGYITDVAVKDNQHVKKGQLLFTIDDSDYTILAEESREGANKQVISSQADSLIKISRIWADFFPANTSNQPI